MSLTVRADAVREDAVRAEAGTAHAVLDDEGRVVVILSGADAADAAADYAEEGFRIVLIQP